MRSQAAVPSSSPHDQGEAVQFALLDAIDGIGLVPDQTAEWYDFVALGADVATDGLEVRANGAVSAGTRGEIKAAQRWISDGPGRRRGRFYVKRAAHEQLCAVDGVYLLAVYVPGDAAPIKHAVLVAAGRVDDALGSWTPVDASWGSADVAKLSWSAVVDPDAVAARGGER